MHEGGNSNDAGQTETQFKLLGGSRDTEDIAGHLQPFCRKPCCIRPPFPPLCTRTRANTYTQTQQIKNDTQPPQEISHAQSGRRGQVAIEY